MNPRTYNVKQCNEIRRATFCQALEKARGMILGTDFDAEKVKALAALAEAAGNDMVSDADDEELD